MWTAAFWRDAFERALKTAAQMLLGLWLVDDHLFDLLTVDWKHAAAVAGGAMVISLLTSVASGVVTVGGENTPSLVRYARK